VAFHHKYGSCSAHNGWGVESGYSCCAIAAIMPFSVKARAFAPLVPMSMPRKCFMNADSLACILAQFPELKSSFFRTCFSRSYLKKITSEMS
jgi:hypothetical protein